MSSRSLALSSAPLVCSDQALPTDHTSNRINYQPVPLTA